MFKLWGKQLTAKPKLKQPPVLFDQTQAIISEVEKASGVPVISYWNAWNANICAADVPSMHQLLKRFGKLERAAIIIKSNGGDIESALRLVHLLRRKIDHLTAYAFGDCASSATIMALGADEIHMGPLAFLTPIDTSLAHELSPINEIQNQRVHVSRDELTRIVRLWGDNAKDHHGNPYTDLFNHVHPLVFGAIDRSNSLSFKICDEVLSYHIDNAKQREKIAQALNTEFPSHSYPITERTARQLGLKVKDLDSTTNQLLLELNEHYSEMAQSAVTDFDEANFHNNQILSVIEINGVQIYYQNNRDENYIKEERRWQLLNDESSWHKVELQDGERTINRLHIS